MAYKYFKKKEGRRERERVEERKETITFLRYNSHTLLKCTIQWILVYSESYTITTIFF